MKKEMVVLTGANKKEIRKQMRTLEEQGIYFGRCVAVDESLNNITMIFRTENQFMAQDEYEKLTITNSNSGGKSATDMTEGHDSRITIGAVVMVSKTGELLKITGYHQYSRSGKEVFCTADGRKWQLNTVYKRCEYICQIDDLK